MMWLLMRLACMGIVAAEVLWTGYFWVWLALVEADPEGKLFVVPVWVASQIVLFPLSAAAAWTLFTQEYS